MTRPRTRIQSVGDLAADEAAGGPHVLVPTFSPSAITVVLRATPPPPFTCHTRLEGSSLTMSMLLNLRPRRTTTAMAVVAFASNCIPPS